MERSFGGARGTVGVGCITFSPFAEQSFIGSTFHDIVAFFTFHAMNTQSPLFGTTSAIQARAIYLGERIDARSLEQTNRLALSPLVIPAGENGYMVLFRYGVVVMFNVLPLQEATLLKYLAPFVPPISSNGMAENFSLHSFCTAKVFLLFGQA